MSSQDNKVDFSKILRRAGYNLPIHEAEVEDFEKNLNITDDPIPSDWDDPTAILKRDKVVRVELKSFEPNNETIKNLSMAARDGKEISDEVRRKMNNDRKSSKK